MTAELDRAPGPAPDQHPAPGPEPTAEQDPAAEPDPSPGAADAAEHEPKHAAEDGGGNVVELISVLADAVDLDPDKILGGEDPGKHRADADDGEVDSVVDSAIVAVVESAEDTPQDTPSSTELVGRHLKPQRVTVGIALFLLIVAAVVGLLQPLATQWVLEALGKAQSLRNPVLILVGTVIGAAAAQGIGQFLMLRVAEDVVLGTRRQMVRQILGLSVGAMHKREPGELMSRVISDSASVRQIALQSVTQSVTGTVVIVGSIGMMVYLDWFLFLVTFAVIAGLCMALFFIMPQIRKAARKTQQNIGAVSNEMERALGTFTTVKASAAEDSEVEAIGTQANRARNSGIRSAMWTALAGMTSALTVQAAFLVVLGVGGLRAQSGDLTVPTLVAFLLYAMQLSQPVLQLTSAVSSFQSGRAALERIAETETFEQESEFVAPGIDPEAVPGGARGDQGPREPEPAVRFEGVTFRYPGSAEPTLKNLTLTIAGLGLTALVGPSGSGKSTVLRLIEGFYPVESGRIWVSNQVLGDWDLTLLREHVAYVEQESPVLAGTIADNLTYGQDGEDVAEHEMGDALEKVGLADRVESLEQPVTHRGNDLSGGERQRISIARALLRRPDLLLLDEVTSQLDASNEMLMRSLIREIAQQIPVLMVAHRLSTVVDADCVVLMQDGRVRATGSHHDLLRRDELYRQMIEQQNINASTD